MNYKADQFFLMDYSLSHWIRIYSKKELYNIYHRSALAIKSWLVDLVYHCHWSSVWAQGFKRFSINTKVTFRKNKNSEKWDISHFRTDLKYKSCPGG